MKDPAITGVPMWAFVSVLSGITLISILVVILLIYRYQRSHKDTSEDQGEYSDKSPIVGYHAEPPRPQGDLKDHNLIISQSTPDLLDNIKPEVFREEKIGRNHYKTVVKQSTLPSVPQRHMLFQRQLSHKLDLSNVEFTIQSVKYKEQPEPQIKPELYSACASKDDDVGKQLRKDRSLEEKACGKLTFSLLYNQQAEQLVVTIIGAEGLPAKDFSGTSDPYVKVYLLPSRKHKYQTKVHRKTLTPEFNESFFFHVGSNRPGDYGGVFNEKTLQFSVYDFDRFSRHDLIGVVILKDLCNLDLFNEQTFTMDIVSVQQDTVDLGELMMALLYLPTAGRLTVHVLKARNLKAMDITGSSDPYVKVSLMCQGKRIKKKKTAVRRSTLNPVFNEGLLFDVPKDNIEDVAIEVKVIDYDRVGSNELMGCCCLGPNQIGPGRDHWYKMIENSRKQVAQWYTLQETLPNPSSPDSKETKEVKHSKVLAEVKTESETERKRDKKASTTKTNQFHHHNGHHNGSGKVK